MDPQQRAVAEEFDKYRDSYSDAVDKAIFVPGLNADFFTRVKADYIHDLAAAHFPDPSAIDALDLGCGVGNYHGLLKNGVGSLTGVDVSTDCIAQARTVNPGVRYDAYDGLRLPYDDYSFDLAFTICVMHHVPVDQWPGFVAEMHRVLRPGGLALVFEHNPYNPMTKLVVNRCPFDADAVLLPSGKTKQLFADAGFKAPQIRHILTIPAAGKLLRKLDSGIGLLPFGTQYYLKATR